MSGRAFSYLVRRRSVRVTCAVVCFCAYGVLALHADEQPSKATDANVAKAEATQRAGAAGSSEKAAAPPTKAHIEELIHDLGSQHYTTRRAAATELRQVGPEAFDLLYAAIDSADPEIASSANYLLRQIPIRWVQADDSAEVRTIMRSYGQEPELRRMRHVEELDRLSRGKGVAALCRIARYDRSSLVSRNAAFVIIRPSEKSKEQPHIDADIVDRELGDSTCASALWLRQYVAQLRDPASSIIGWKRLIDEESARLDKNMGDTSNDIVLGLAWNLADLYRQTGDQAALNGALDRMIGLAADGSDETLVSLLAWLTENKSWDVLDAFLGRHQARLEQSKRPLYFAALARAKQGKKDQAEDLAAKAALLPPQERTLDGLLMAKDLEMRLQFDWAVREYRRSIEKQPSESIENILSRIWLANLLHDYEREKDAAETLEPLATSVQKDGGRAAVNYASKRETFSDSLDMPEPKELDARLHYYRACQYQSAKDWKSAQKELEQAVESDWKDADVLIAMFQMPNADAEWHKKAVTHVQKLTRKLEKDIADNPSDASPYNQWAWLISNTEGDFKQAVQYSHRSLELNKHGDAGSASFLDTLGRCYYSVGDYENAVKYEREAIAKNDYMQVMRRQLAMFEKALADKKKADEKKPADKSS